MEQVDLVKVVTLEAFMNLARNMGFQTILANNTSLKTLRNSAAVQFRSV